MSKSLRRKWFFVCLVILLSCSDESKFFRLVETSYYISNTYQVFSYEGKQLTKIKLRWLNNELPLAELQYNKVSDLLQSITYTEDCPQIDSLFYDNQNNLVRIDRYYNCISSPENKHTLSFFYNDSQQIRKLTKDLGQTRYETIFEGYLNGSATKITFLQIQNEVIFGKTVNILSYDNFNSPFQAFDKNFLLAYYSKREWHHLISAKNPTKIETTYQNYQSPGLPSDFDGMKINNEYEQNRLVKSTYTNIVNPNYVESFLFNYEFH